MTIGKDRILVAMSGGVDSAATACLLRERGYAVEAAFLCLRRVGQYTNERACCSPQDANDAQRVADILGIKLTVLPVTHQFEWLAAEAAREYARGKTPNPCVICNARIKVAMLLELADQKEIPYLATGHYARVFASGDSVRIGARGQSHQRSVVRALRAG